MSLVNVLELELAVGTPGLTGVWQDLALESGFRIDVITDDEAEYDRVRSATRVCHPDLPLAPIIEIIDRVPLAPRYTASAGRARTRRRPTSRTHDKRT